MSVWCSRSRRPPRLTAAFSLSLFKAAAAAAAAATAAAAAAGGAT